MQRPKEQTMIYKTPHRKPKNTNPTKNQGRTHVLRMGRQFLLPMWDPSCYSCYTHGDKS
jgi:hypothetical protein